MTVSVTIDNQVTSLTWSLGTWWGTVVFLWSVEWQQRHLIHQCVKALLSYSHDGGLHTLVHLPQTAGVSEIFLTSLVSSSWSVSHTLSVLVPRLESLHLSYLENDRDGPWMTMVQLISVPLSSSFLLLKYPSTGSNPWASRGSDFLLE